MRVLDSTVDSVPRASRCLIGAVLVAVCLMPSCRAEPDHKMPIELSGNQSTNVDVTFSSTDAPDGVTLEIQIGGDWAAYMITRTSTTRNDRWVGWGYFSPPVHSAAKAAHPIKFVYESQLEPDSYRIHLISDKPALVRIPTEGLVADHDASVEANDGPKRLGTPMIGSGVRRSVKKLKQSITSLVRDPILKHIYGVTQQRSGTRFDSTMRWAVWEPPSEPVGTFSGVRRVVSGVTRGDYFALTLDVDLTSPKAAGARQ